MLHWFYINPFTLRFLFRSLEGNTDSGNNIIPSCCWRGPQKQQRKVILESPGQVWAVRLEDL